MRIILILAYFIVITVCDEHQTRKNCPPHKNISQPPNRVPTTARLTALRKLMQGLQALLVTSDDEHQTEDVSKSDKRREYISGFSGINGDAIITIHKAVLWTDGRYHLQADEQLDCNWLLMREGNAKVPSKAEWLHSHFPHGGKIGADDKLLPANVWNDLESQLKKLNKNFTLVATKGNLIDKVWKDRPLEKIKEAYTLDVYYTGEIWTKKLQDLRKELAKRGADGMVVTALDEIAWLLNIRGWDVPNSGFLKSYVYLNPMDTILYVNLNKTKRNVTNFFNNYYPGQLKFRNYDDIWSDLPNYSKVQKMILVPSLCGFSAGVSKRIYNLIPHKKRLSRPSPIIYMKAKKNPTEIEGMKRGHIRDAAALCNFFQHFESLINSGKFLDEYTLSKKVDQFRSKQKSFVSNSFSTIVAFGPHGALPHYVPTPKTSSAIFATSTVVIDSGGQYYDATTDVTRTIHIGNPTKEHKEAYTRVLIGAIQLSSLIFPDNLNTSTMDVMARAKLWEVGYDYSHGTGHGIGSFLAVHESPIIIKYNPLPNKPPQLLKAGHFHSIEPGMYLAGKFGIRLENVVEVIKKEHLKQQQGHHFLGFNDVTLVPYETKLIDFNLLNVEHRRWLNRYNSRIRHLVGAELKHQNATEAFQWMWKNTEHIPDHVKFY